jgi:alkylated DNA repair protein alkB family protein 6
MKGMTALRTNLRSSSLSIPHFTQPHEDGPLYKPNFGILSLDNTIMMDIYNKRRPNTTNHDIPANLHPEILNDSDICTSLGHQLPLEPIFSLVLQPRSLLVFKDALYTDYLHGIARRRVDVLDNKIVNLTQAGLEEGTVLPRAHRISLTIRVVHKTLKNKIKLAK